MPACSGLKLQNRISFCRRDVVVRKLEELKKQGHKLLIDDFGMGHTSLLYLQSEYFDVVKLDGSLTRPLFEKPYESENCAFDY